MKRIILHDLDDGTFPSVKEVYDRFIHGAADAGVERDFAAFVFADALAGDACSRELVEETCRVEFL